MPASAHDAASTSNGKSGATGRAAPPADGHHEGRGLIVGLERRTGGATEENVPAIRRQRRVLLGHAVGRKTRSPPIPRPSIDPDLALLGIAEQRRRRALEDDRRAITARPGNDVTDESPVVSRVSLPARDGDRPQMALFELFVGTERRRPFATPGTLFNRLGLVGEEVDRGCRPATTGSRKRPSRAQKAHAPLRRAIGNKCTCASSSLAARGKKCQRSAVGRPPRARLAAFAARQLFRVLTVDPDAPDVPDALVLAPIRGVLHVGHREAVR